MVWHNDEPLDFANSVHIFALSELAKRHVTVVLTGEGSDELFAGYPRYRIPDLAKSYRLVPAPHAPRARRAGSRSPAGEAGSLCGRYADRGACSTTRATCGPSVVARGVSAHERLRARRSGRECLERPARRSDLDSVGTGVAARSGDVPRLDPPPPGQDEHGGGDRVARAVHGLSDRGVRQPPADATTRFASGTGKAIVKDVARSVLPAEIVDRRKSGFGVPLARWFRSDDGLGERIVALPDSPAADVFDRAVLRRIIAEHRQGTHDHSELLWTALNLATWRDVFDC